MTLQQSRTSGKLPKQLRRKAPMKPGGPLPRMSAKKAAVRELGDEHPTSAEPKMATAKPKRQKYTGPKPKVCELVDKRSGGRCEFPACTRPQDHRHHRLNRKAGGRKGEMRERLNGPAWLLGVCFTHHEIVTNPPEGQIDTLRRMGWILREGQDALQVEVRTRHHVDPVWLDDAGDWHEYEVAAA